MQSIYNVSTDVNWKVCGDETAEQGEAAELARVFAALGDPIRLRLISLVASRGEVRSCDLERPLGRSQPTISHHTRIPAGSRRCAGRSPAESLLSADPYLGLQYIPN